jgi:hypothetical protein
MIADLPNGPQLPVFNELGPDLYSTSSDTFIRQSSAEFGRPEWPTTRRAIPEWALDGLYRDASDDLRAGTGLRHDDRHAPPAVM